MNRLLAAAIFTVLSMGVSVSAQDAPPISPAQLQKLLKVVDTIGAKEEFPAPTAQNLGISTDPTRTLPVILIVTNDHTVYFGRSQIDPADYIIWVRSPDSNASYMFSTRSDFKLIRALYLRADGFPDIVDGDTTQVQEIYKKALAALVKDVNSTPSK
jgi:hypothetical protein